MTGNAYRALGCVGAITDGSARDVDEAAYGGIKLMARRLCVGHAYSCPVRFGGAVEMYGTTIRPGMLVHADKYGFIAIPEDETPYLLEATRFCDSLECKTTHHRRTRARGPHCTADRRAAEAGKRGILPPERRVRRGDPAALR